MLKIISGLAGSRTVTETELELGSENKRLPLLKFEQCQEDCRECIRKCPTEAISQEGVNPRLCIYCQICADVCPAKLITFTDIPLIQPESSLEETGRSLQARIKQLCRGSLHIRYVDAGACNGCDFEINALTNPVYDIQQYGIDFVASPRHADMLLVTGVVTRNLEVALMKTYEACPKPTLVVAVGSCACGGGVFKDAYAAGGGVDKHLPVDVYIPGCPPTPSLILKGILTAIGR